MLRSENVQVRSQLSIIQRRMFQEKQQIMDYLHQTEDNLIKTRTTQTASTKIFTMIKDDEKIKLELELNTYKLKIKRLYSHFNINIDSIEQLRPILEDRLLQVY
ncbi:unnamed protein product [Rotaria sp. Silwood2]|nr:unnamed protein product [Rotaria sp. Silwood2]CAF3081189.1 unnamed protein product [Rotaria sp. Silwood2]CAF3427214.1 unnamed protein product [Rotaria sp. Silwood2]CAF4651604.1 unnamed protein product [Rotaria sp. Silwood2]CAF4682932.1 unnamed protein product [Rotaria sp. Silwood2]